MRLRFHPSAQQELVAAVEYYESASAGLGRRFHHAVVSVAELIEDHPEIGSPQAEGTREVPVRGFPFRIVYRVDGSAITLVAVAHQRRRPGYWRDRP